MAIVLMGSNVRPRQQYYLSEIDKCKGYIHHTWMTINNVVGKNRNKLILPTVQNESGVGYFWLGLAPCTIDKRKTRVLNRRSNLLKLVNVLLDYIRICFERQ